MGPFMRNIPLNAARNLGKSTRVWRGVPIVYILLCFIVFPFILLGLSVLFTRGVKGLTVLGSMLTVALILGLAYTLYWFIRANGEERIITKMTDMQSRRSAIQTLPEDIALLKSKIQQLEEHAGLQAEEAPAESNADDKESIE